MAVPLFCHQYWQPSTYVAMPSCPINIRKSRGNCGLHRCHFAQNPFSSQDILSRVWQPLPDLRKGCVPRDFTHAEFSVGISLISIQLDSFLSPGKIIKVRFEMYSKRLTSASTKCNIIKHPPTKYVSKIFFFNFAPAGKNVRNVKFTYIEYYLIRGVAV
jgi:hypothetical protein